jgi:predicted transcriptional regulator
MELRLAPELEAKLSQMAAERGREPQSLVQEVIERLIDYDEWFIREVEKGLAQVDAGEVIEHEQIGRRLEELISKKQRTS